MLKYSLKRRALLLLLLPYNNMAMKKIIIPTDFSPAALNAVNYAADMALAINAGIHLLHIYQLPISVTDAPLVLISVEELKENAEKKLAKLKKDLEHITSGKLDIQTESRLGDLTDELEDCCNMVQPFVVVMGTRGHSAVEKALFGSNTLSVIKHLGWPVICVPTGKEYGVGIKQIGLACDFREVLETTPVSMIKLFVKELKAVLHVLNVAPENNHAKTETPAQVVLLQTALEDVSPEYHFIKHKDVEDGINEFAEINNLDMIIAIPKKHKLMEGLFRKSATRQLVFESHVPVMCVH
jgi:nucleotide-binding universal stress UspA family protein